MRNFAQYVSRFGENFLLSVTITGDERCYMPSIANCLLYYNIHFRTSIESSYSHEVDQLRKQYTQEDKELIKKFLEARNSSLKSKGIVQEMDSEDINCKYNLPSPTPAFYYHMSLS